MHAYWIQYAQGNTSMASLGYGVTARSIADAKSLLGEAFPQIANTSIAEMREITHIDQIEPNHVRPNMGDFMRRGIWFPNMGSPS